MWQDERNRLALLELWAKGFLRRRTGQAEAWDELARLPWTRRTSRRDEIALDNFHRPDLEALLDRSFPGWRAVHATLVQHGLSLDIHGWKRMKEDARAATLPPSLPSLLNQRTAAAAMADHSKATLSERLRRALGSVEITRDGIVRMRPNAGLLVEGEGEVWAATRIADVLGELTLTERALKRGTRLAGVPPKALLSVENVGFYIDVAPPDGWAVVHVPGWNTTTVRLLLEQMADIPLVHIGDLDPAGLRIVAHLQELRPGLHWAVPEFWEDYIETRGLRASWPTDLDLEGAPPLVSRLAATGIWLEQEALALDPRLLAYLASFVDTDIVR